MNTQIKKTETGAIQQAKLIAISKFEKAEGMTVNDDNFINSKAWVINYSSCECECGRTPSIDVSLLPKFLNNEDLKGAYTDNNDNLTTDDLSEDSDDDLYNGLCGYCENCGK